MKKFLVIFIALFCAVVAGCDLQPKIASIPDDVGEFISNRYPTLLAEPDSEIYKTAVADYGVYASATEYGNGDVSENDYVLYSPADDYMMPAQDSYVSDADAGMPDDEETSATDDDDDDEESYAPDTDVDDLKIPDYVNGKPVEEKKVEEKPQEKTQEKPKPQESKQDKPKSAPKKESNDDEKTADLMRAPLRDVTVAKGDTLYSISREYSVPVNDLAVLNKMSAPFALSVGQKIKVPDVLSVPSKSGASGARAATTKPESKPVVKKSEVKASDVKSEVKDVKKTESKSKNINAASDVKTPSVKKPDTVKADVKAKTKKPVAKKSDVKPTNKQPTGKSVKPDAKKVDNASGKTAKKTEPAKKVDTKKTTAKGNEKTKTAQKTENKKRSAKQLAARSSSKFSWPLRGKILSGFGSKPNGLVNDGINISGTRGASVLAAENGFVAYAGNEVKGMGNLVIIQHSDGWMTVYAHMDTMNVRRGSTVAVGQKIGTVGQSGKVDRPQLHFEIRKGTRAYNPISYLKK